MCHMNRGESEAAPWDPPLGVSGRPGHAGYLVNSSNLLKATMAPIRWDSGEKPLSMKSSVLCLSRSGLVSLMGTAILQGDGRRGGEAAARRSCPKSCSDPGDFVSQHKSSLPKEGHKIRAGGD